MRWIDFFMQTKSGHIQFINSSPAFETTDFQELFRPTDVFGDVRYGNNERESCSPRFGLEDEKRNTETFIPNLLGL